MTEARTVEQELAKLRKTGGDHFDPVRFRYIEAMVRRSARCSGAAASAIATRALDAIDAYRIALQQSDEGEPAPAATATRGAREGLAALTALLAKNSDEIIEAGSDNSLDQRLRQEELEIVRSLSGNDTTANGPANITAGELGAVRQMRDALHRVDTERRISRFSREAPDESGPLNPQRLVTDTLATMYQLSPRYLSRLISYADTLLWLEQAGACQDREKPAPNTNNNSR